MVLYANFFLIFLLPIYGMSVGPYCWRTFLPPFLLCHCHGRRLYRQWCCYFLHCRVKLGLYKIVVIIVAPQNGCFQFKFDSSCVCLFFIFNRKHSISSISCVYMWPSLCARRVSVCVCVTSEWVRRSWIPLLQKSILLRFYRYGFYSTFIWY